MYSLEEIAYSFINRFRFSFVLSMLYVISLRTSLVLGWKLRDEGLECRSHHTIFCMEADKYKIVRQCPKCDVTLPQHLPSGSLPLLIGSVGVPTRLGAVVERLRLARIEKRMVTVSNEQPVSGAIGQNSDMDAGEFDNLR